MGFNVLTLLIRCFAVGSPLTHRLAMERPLDAGCLLSLLSNHRLKYVFILSRHKKHRYRMSDTIFYIYWRRLFLELLFLRKPTKQ
jgi:hypothetical protein